MFYLFSLKEDTMNYNCEMKYIKVIVQNIWFDHAKNDKYEQKVDKNIPLPTSFPILTDLIGIINLSNNWNIIVCTEKKRS